MSSKLLCAVREPQRKGYVSRFLFVKLINQAWRLQAAPGTKEYSFVAYQHPDSDKVWFGGRLSSGPVQSDGHWRFPIESAVNINQIPLKVDAEVGPIITKRRVVGGKRLVPSL